MLNKNKQRSLQRIIFQVLLLVVTSGMAYVIVLFLDFASASTSDLKLGDVSDQDVLAPYAITYKSEVLTDQMREAAVMDVPTRYSAADTNIARKQLERLRLALAYITTVRADSYSDVEGKLADLAALQDIQLSQVTAAGILTLSDPRWQTIQQEAIVVLEQVMRNTIRDTAIESYRQNVNNLVSLSLPEDQAAIVAELAAAFIAPNSFLSESMTELAKQEVFASVAPVSVSYATGETIIRRGEKVSAVDLEALQNFGLAEMETRWQDYASVGIYVALSACLIVIFFRRNQQLLQDFRSLFIIALLFIVYLAVARLVLPIHPLTPYIYPVAAYALIIAGLFGAETGLITVIPLILLSTYRHGNDMELILYYTFSSIFGVLIPRQEQRITGFMWVGLSVTASGAGIITIYRLLDSETTGLILLTFLGIALLNGMITAGFTVLAQSVLAPLLGQTTPLQLLELSRPDHPILEYLLRNAPGTYQHSLQVANLAEQAAERIDADSLLTRVGALYHDIGKVKNSQFFVENQVPGQLDTHENIDAVQSATIIIHHVTEGLNLARSHKLPRRIQNFITEHHGTFKTRYQWTQAVNAVGGDTSQLEENDFKYNGPRPQSRETALVMLADGCEARVRAMRPPNEDDLRTLIKETVDTCLTAGQLDDTPLTLKDLNVIIDSFAATLKGIYHPRIEYPSLDVPTRPIPPQTLESWEKQESPQSVDESHTADTQPVP